MLKVTKKHAKENKIHMLIRAICKKLSIKTENIFSIKGAHAKESRIHELYRKVVKYAHNLCK